MVYICSWQRWCLASSYPLQLEPMTLQTLGVKYYYSLVIILILRYEGTPVGAGTVSLGMAFFLGSIMEMIGATYLSGFSSLILLHES